MINGTYELENEHLYNSDLFWNHSWLSVQWGAIFTEISEVNLFVFVDRLFHEEFSLLNKSS